MRRWRESIFVIAIVLIAFALGVMGLDWGLPSAERNAFYFPDGKYPRVPVDEVKASAHIYPEFSDAAPRPRSTFNAIRSCHPDEHYVLKGLANMDPLAGDFTTGLYGWPSLIFYIEGFGLTLARLVGYVTLTHDVTYYFEHPDAIARMYHVGRLMVVLFGVATVLVIYWAARFYYDRQTAEIAALIAAVSPLLTVHMHYMTGDVPMLFFACLGVYFCLRTYGSHRLRWPLLAGMALGLAMSAKYKAVVLLPMIPFAAAMRASWHYRWFEKLQRAWGRPVLAGLACAFGVFALLNFQVVLHPIEFWRIFTGEVTSVAINAGAEARAAVGWWPRLTRMAARAVYGPADVLMRTTGPWPLILAFGAIVRALVLQRRRVWLIIAGFALVYLTMGAIGTVYARHLMLLVPFLALLAGRFVIAGWHTFPFPPARRVLMWLCAGLIVSTCLCKSLAYTRLFSAHDIRLTAAEWIARHVPAGSSIGMAEVPWQYDTPPINEARHPVVVTGYSADKLRKLKPDYFLISSRHRDPILRKPTPERDRFWREVLNYRRYSPLREFSTSPFIYARTAPTSYSTRSFLKWTGFLLDNSDAPEDMRYANPRMILLRRVERPG